MTPLCAGIPGLNPCINQDVTVGNVTFNYYEFLVREGGSAAAWLQAVGGEGRAVRAAGGERQQQQQQQQRGAARVAVLAY